MKRPFQRILALLLASSLSASLAAQDRTLDTLKLPKARSIFDISHDYHVQLLMFALKKSGDYPTLPRLEETFEMSTGRAEQELFTGNNVDIYWLGANSDNAERLIEIPIPTTRGLIGYRKFLIHKNSEQKLDQVKSIADLATLKACQGSHWPDTAILRSAGLPVVTSAEYETLFKLLNGERCDYFPRGYHDFIGELETRDGIHTQLKKYHRILLHYPFAVYFYASKQNKALASSVQKGLEMMAESGELEAFMMIHPLTAATYPLSNDPATLILNIPNEAMKNAPHLSDPRYWIPPKEFQISPKN